MGTFNDQDLRFAPPEELVGFGDRFIVLPTRRTPNEFVGGSEWVAALDDSELSSWWPREHASYVELPLMKVR